MTLIAWETPRLLFLLLLCAALLALLFAGCQEDGKDDPAPEGSVQDFSAPLGDVRSRARQADTYLANYAPWDAQKIDVARRHQIVIVHPSHGNLTRDTVASIQQGVDPANPSDDVVVLGYISIGEDLRTRHLTDAELAADPRFRGDGTGPRVDPRGPHADGGPLEGIDPLGSPSPGGTGYASWYLDDNDVDRNGIGDGKPDRNRNFSGAFVNAGDPKWFEVLNDMILDGPDAHTGLKEILTTTHGRGLGCDGLFLDTIDTCAPNSFTDASSNNPSEFEWTAPGFSAFIRRLRQTYPNAVVLQNRGLFFFDPRHPHYRVTTRGAIDLAFFESFRLNSNSFEEFNSYFYPDNRYNVAPKLMAEANRPDGFRVLSLGYAEGPPGAMSRETLTGGSTVGLSSLLEDIRVAQEQGFRHYLTDASVELVNSFVRDNANFGDTTPPRWSSTFNPNNAGFPAPPGEPPARVGIQEVEPGPGQVVVRWDVALDLNPVRYALYYQAQPFDFARDPLLTGATRVELVPRVGKGYGQGIGVGPGIFPFEATVSGLETGRTYYFVVRAHDTSPSRNEESNQTVRTATPH